MEHNPLSAGDLALLLIQSAKRDEAYRDAERLKNAVLNEPEILDIKTVAREIGDYLIDQIADAPCTIETHGVTPTLQDELIQLARAIQENRKTR